MSSEVRIRWPDGEESWQVIPDGVSLTVGRRADRDWVLAHPSVSSRHATVRCRDGRVEIRDDASRFGTYVDELRLVAGEWRTLGAGASAWVGELRLDVPNAPREAPAPEADLPTEAFASRTAAPAAAPMATSAPPASSPSDPPPNPASRTPAPPREPLGALRAAALIAAAAGVGLGIWALTWVFAY